MASILAHELEEAITDPDLNAWFDLHGMENADKCAWQFGPTKTAANGSKYNQTLAGFNWLIQMNWVNSGGGSCQQTNSSACPVSVALEPTPGQQAPLEVVRTFRDDVMATTPVGQFYVNLYYKHAAEGTQLLQDNPGLRNRARMVLDRLLPKLQAVMAGKPATITNTDRAAIEALLNAVAAQASPALQADLQAVREDLRQGTLLEALEMSSSD
jgi:hypothetical protein